jgi:hypothetical protein
VAWTRASGDTRFTRLLHHFRVAFALLSHHLLHFCAADDIPSSVDIPSLIYEPLMRRTTFNPVIRTSRIWGNTGVTYTRKTAPRREFWNLDSSPQLLVNSTRPTTEAFCPQIKLSEVMAGRVWVTICRKWPIQRCRNNQNHTLLSKLGDNKGLPIDSADFYACFPSLSSA